ncbi:MAG: penicillin acylase family protein [Promicromonosporaceae bacterium]|nr:penicillin acylase family protein [Promicromonosporaceae bacterium]
MSVAAIPAEPPPLAPEPEAKAKTGVVWRRWRVPVVILAVVVLLLAAAVVTGVILLRRPLPTTGGVSSIPGLQGTVQVTIDDEGVPRIFADSPTDLFRAQGYLDATDRFFQMDYRRHVASGTIASFVGGAEGILESYRLVRTMNWRGVAAAEWELLDLTTQAILEAYAEGVNAYLAGRTPGEISIEYLYLSRQFGQRPIAQWSPVDSLVLLKALAWEMRANADEEIDRALAYSTLGDIGVVDRLFPPYEAGGNPTILSAPEFAATGTGQQPGAAASSSLVLPVTAIPEHLPQGQWLGESHIIGGLTALRELLGVVPRTLGSDLGTGSNSWVVSGRYTASGGPLLANDPHLTLSIPGPFRQVGLFCTEVSAACPHSVIGFSLIGFPGVYVGHNDSLAWGMTSLHADVADLFIEHVRDDEFLLDSTWQPMTVRYEEIEIAGSGSQTLRVREVAGRPLLSDILDMSAVETSPAGESGTDHAVSLAWTALTPFTTSAGLLSLNTATDAADVADAAALFGAPAQAIVFATTTGDIGFQSAGLIPLRPVAGQPLVVADGSAVPSDGTWPQDGKWSSNHWKGFIPPSELPRVLNPEAGFIVAANQAILPTGVGPFLGSDFDYGFRAARITEMLTEFISAGVPLTPALMNQIQFDAQSPAALALVPRLTQLPLDSDWAAAGQALLKDWDFQMSADSAAAAYFASTWNHILQLTFWDELPEGVRPDGTSRWLVVVKNIINYSLDPFWDDRSTLNVVESRDEILTMALVASRNELTTRISSNASDWSWGALHRLILRNPVLGNASQPWLLQTLANPGALGVSGSTLSINSTAWPAGANDMDVITGSAFRIVMDLGNFAASTWVNLAGNSGHIGSPHYDDQIEAWLNGEQFPFGFRDAYPQTSFMTLSPTSLP